MEETLQRQLYKELDRLQNVIDVLLEQNAQLKRTICHYKQLSDGAANKLNHHAQVSDAIKDQFYAHVSETDMPPTHLCSILLQTDGAKMLQQPTRFKNDGAKSHPDLTLPQNDGVKMLRQPTGFKNDGVKTFQQPIGLQKDGGKQNTDAIPNRIDSATIESLYLHESRSALITFRKGEGDNSSGTSPVGNACATPGNSLPASGKAITLSKDQEEQAISNLLFDKLLTITPTSNSSGLNNTISVLMVLKQSPKQSLKDLQKLTGLSEDGMVKRIMAMKKAGLIVRAPHKRLLYLTPLAEKMLEEAKA